MSAALIENPDFSRRSMNFDDSADTEESEKATFEQLGVQEYLSQKRFEEEKKKHTIGSVMQRYVSISVCLNYW